jgi:uncharacterized protein (TIGR01777 family)
MGMKMVMYGASGFVGGGLAELLAKDGWEVIGVSRKGFGDVSGVAKWVKPNEVDLTGVNAVVNLAGEPIDQRWTDAKKQSFHASRVGVTDEIVAKIAALPESERPSVLVNASAVGFYGGCGDDVLLDEAARGNGYLADLCAAWEESALKAEAYGVRVVRVRIGVVLGAGGKAFEKLMIVFKAGLGGRLGSGQQWMPWIHVEDLQRAIAFCVNNEGMKGAVNGTAPNPERNTALTQKMAKAVGRWVFLPVPGFVLKIVMGRRGYRSLHIVRDDTSSNIYWMLLKSLLMFGCEDM